MARSARLIFFRLALSLGVLGLAGVSGRAYADDVELAIVLSRHGVRSPLQPQEQLNAISGRPWPVWEVKPGIQTQQGNLLVAFLADYYHARFAGEGLLSGDAATDAQRVFLRADNDQRTIQTAGIIGKALVPENTPEVQALPEGTMDTLFQPIAAGLGHPDRELATAAVLGRLGGDASSIDRVYARQFSELRAVLVGPGDPQPASADFDAPTAFRPGAKRYLIDTSGRLRVAFMATEALLLAYADGKDASEVGWGRLDEKTLTDLLTLHDLAFDLQQRTFYPAQVNGSNLLSHIVDTLEQAATGDTVTGALGPVGEKVVVLVGHDTNIANIGGLFGMNWSIPGFAQNPLVPGGAMVFELVRRSGEGGGPYVRVSYIAQTLDELRSAQPLTPGHPPAVAPIFVPGCSGTSPDYASPLAAFVRQARRVIDPKFVTEAN